MIRNWIIAFRLRTLPLAVSSVLMGSFLAQDANAFRWDIFCLCIMTTVLLQVLSNLANDYGDSVHGADSAYRKGPKRAVQSGAIHATAMRNAVIVFTLLSLGSGVTLLFVAFGSDWNAIIFFLGVGVLCILAAIAYTVGRKPYGYAGLGDFSVFIFFGFVGVMGSFYLFTQQVSWLVLLPAASCGLFSMGVLNVNNIRDIESDRKAGKYSIPVRIGREKAVIYHWFLLLSGIATSVIYMVITFHSIWQLLFILSIPLFIYNGKKVPGRQPGELDPLLKQLALSTLLFVFLFGIGMVL